MTFVDTGAWYALYVPDDADHAAANAWRKANRDRLVTTDAVLIEALNLFTARGEPRRARALGKSLLAEIGAKLIRTTSPDFDRAWRVFQGFADKQWSFTDCISYVVIERLRIKKAFAFDQHFRQFGIVEVVP